MCLTIWWCDQLKNYRKKNWCFERQAHIMTSTHRFPPSFYNKLKVHMPLSPSLHAIPSVWDALSHLTLLNKLLPGFHTQIKYYHANISQESKHFIVYVSSSITYLFHKLSSSYPRFPFFSTQTVRYSRAEAELILLNFALTTK